MEGHGWVAAATCSTLALWGSEQLWPYHSLMSLDAWILHSGHAKSLHFVACVSEMVIHRWR